jgi:hypothetical protein
METTTNRYNRAFKSYACEGDTVATETEGFTVTARIERDTDYRIDDDDSHNIDQSVTGCDDEQQKELLATRKAWFNDEWFFCGIILSISKNGILLDNSAASLWSVECNYPNTKNEYPTEVANDLLEEAIEQGKQSLAYMIHKLTLDKSLRPGFEYECECGYYVCDCCGYPAYPIEIDTDVEGKDICPNCEQGNMLEMKKG